MDMHPSEFDKWTAAFAPDASGSPAPNRAPRPGQSDGRSSSIGVIRFCLFSFSFAVLVGEAFACGAMLIGFGATLPAYLLMGAALVATASAVVIPAVTD